MNSKDFFELDFHWSLFPLQTNFLMIQHHHEALETYISKILSDDPAYVGDSFLPQTRVHAAKPRNHLRRTVVLDPIASFFLYDLINRNRIAFGQPGLPTRQAFGYRFTNERPLAVHTAFQEFSANVDANRLVYHHSISFDIASYFNSIYHHDATNWFASLSGVSGADGNAFGRFFREINAGRSIDFLPQGIYPAKMIGSEFLKFVDLSGQVKCAQLLRFMDDIYLFDNDEKVLLHDFLRIQELLGLRGLNINPSKTSLDKDEASIHDAASTIQNELASIINADEHPSMYLGSGADGPEFDSEDDSDEEVEPQSLDDDQINRLHALLLDPSAEEAEVESILKILYDNSESDIGHVPDLIARFPNIVKQLYKVAGRIEDKENLASEIINLINSNKPLIEYQLFWIAVIAEDHLMGTKSFGKLILSLYERTAEHKIARAKILEIPDQSFGLKEIRDEILKTGASDWPSWASAIGTRTLKKAERNYALKYFSKGSPLNHLIADCVQ
ncbi:MAG TPA: antiviral reverse transcriptase Drt5, partial [Acidobacteriota bacterium]|nr:antiviral reverse transcriptase Drt5 [Acidobacteriota bacterium]